MIPTDSCNALLRDQYAQEFRELSHSRVIEVTGIRGNVAHIAARAVTHMGYRHPWFLRHSARSLRLEGLEGLGLADTGRPFIGVPALASLGSVPEEIRELLSSERPLVCFANRDPSYWSERTESEPRRYRGTSYAGAMRNVDPRPYIPAINFLISKGYNVVRMGRVASQPLDVTSAHFFDYARSGETSDELDLLLFSRCVFSLFGGSSGIASLASTFGKPLVIADFRPFNRPFYSTTWAIVCPSFPRDHSDEVVGLAEYLAYSSDLSITYDRLGWNFEPTPSSQILDAVATACRFLESQEEPYAFTCNPEQIAFWDAWRTHTPRSTVVPNGAHGAWSLREPPLSDAWSRSAMNTVLNPSFLERTFKAP